MGRGTIRYSSMPPPRARGPRSRLPRSATPASISYSIKSSHRTPLQVTIQGLSSSALSSPRSTSTSQYSLRSSTHGRKRRQQRGIKRRQLQQAMKYGFREPTGSRGRSKYTYNDIVFVIEDATHREVTSYARKYNLPLHPISLSVRQEHTAACLAMQSNPVDYCESHSVLIVDTSGSMRNSDVFGARNRLSAVWFAMAQDFIKNRIDSGIAGTKDVLSVILMGEEATLHPELHNVPTDWVTYNNVLSIYREGKVQPKGHGCFRPALKVAENILMQYASSNCRMVLAILSDGRPSDHRFQRTSFEKGCNSIVELVGSLSSKLGKRLTVSTIGMGSANQFQTLQDMTTKAKDFGSDGSFMLPSLSSSGIGAAISSIATSLTDAQSELNDMGGSRRRRLVHAVEREDRRRLPALTTVVSPNEFNIYMHDAVVHKEYDHSIVGPDPFRVTPLQHPEAAGVAIAKKAFGEGTERFAYQFFEVAQDGVTVVGEPLVAKSSRFVMEQQDQEDQKSKFLRRFCRIHYQAGKVADAFNAKLDSIKTLDEDTARVSFLPCSVYVLTDPNKGVLTAHVERRLFGAFQKWNNNNGWKQGNEPVARRLDIIPEEVVSMQEEPVAEQMEEDGGESIFVKDGEVAQAFSHFSYILGGRKSLVCDLQGVCDRQNHVLCFTDPVIHYHDAQKEHKKGQYGRTDRGDKGISDFLKTHNCNALCKIVTTGFFSIPASKVIPEDEMQDE